MSCGNQEWFDYFCVLEDLAANSSSSSQVKVLKAISSNLCRLCSFRTSWMFKKKLEPNDSFSNSVVLSQGFQRENIKKPIMRNKKNIAKCMCSKFSVGTCNQQWQQIIFLEHESFVWDAALQHWVVLDTWRFWKCSAD